MRTVFYTFIGLAKTGSMRSAAATIAITLLLVACASQPTPVAHQVPGLLVGFFHGFTAILSLVGSLFMHIRIYEFPNSGFWYDFGFVAGFATSMLAMFLTFMARIGGMVT
jgi:hypothetical protein